MDASVHSEFVPNVHFELIPVKNLVSNQNYQRELSIRHVNKNANEFDLYQINPVKVSRRNGINYVFDGQHTIETVAKVSGSRETPVWCMIYDDLTYQEEADIFANQKRGTKNLLPFEIFNANVEAGNDFQLTIKAVVDSYKLRIGPSSGDGCICAVAALEQVFRRYGYHILDKTLLILVATWEGDKLSLGAGFIKAVALLCVKYKERLNPELFASRLCQHSPAEIIRNAKERGNGSLGYAEAMVHFYNKKTKAGLKLITLYETDPNAPNNEAEDPDETDEADGPAEPGDPVGHTAPDEEQQLSVFEPAPPPPVPAVTSNDPNYEPSPFDPLSLLDIL